MILGFTGTRKGMTTPQKKSVAQLLIKLSADELHHGDCIGADAEVNMIAGEIGYIHRVAHPAENASLRAFCEVEELRLSRPFLERDRDICAESDLLIAAPGEHYEKHRSGTWYTVRHARKLKRPVIVVYPDGNISSERISQLEKT